MDSEAFRDGLRRDGFRDLGDVDRPAGRINPEHAHDFDVRALVLDGEITITAAGQSVLYRKGDIFAVDRQCRHSETIGPDGVRFVFGRRDHGRA